VCLGIKHPSGAYYQIFQSKSHIATDGQSISKSWCRASSGAHDQIFITLFLLFDSYGVVFSGALSNERAGLSFVYAAGPHQASFSRVRVPWDSWPYFIFSDLRLPLSSPSTTRRVTVEVFEPASTWVQITAHLSRYIAAERTWTCNKHISRDRYPASLLARRSYLQKTYVTWLLSTVVTSPRVWKTQLHLLLLNLATDSLPRICLRGNLFTNPLPRNGCTCIIAP
jgi:hypothetical protein